MAMRDLDEITVEFIFEDRYFDGEMFMVLYNGIKNSLEFFYEKIIYHSNYCRTKVSMLDALITFQKEEIIIFNVELKSFLRLLKEESILPSVKIPDCREFSNLCDQIVEIDNLSSDIISKFNSLKKLLNETKKSLSEINLYTLFFPPCNVEEKCKALMQKYEKEQQAKLKIYIDDFESADAVKATLREEYKDSKAVKCWKCCAHDMEMTILAMFRVGCVERELLPLFEYIAKCKMLDWKFGWLKIGSEINEARSSQMYRNTMINIYDCPSVNIGQAQDIISEGGIKNVYNHKKQ